jgi:signal transduction histidine kinase/ligand-binding sensor domain-containing protein
MKKLLLLSLLCLTLDVVFAQPTKVIKRFTTKDGLTHNTVIGSFIDEYGFVWLSTMDGISRYDANGFKTYKMQDYPDLPSNFVHSVSAWGKDTLLITTRDQGLALFIRDENRFTGIRPKAGKISDNQYAMIRVTQKWSPIELLIGFSIGAWVLYNVQNGKEQLINFDFELEDAESFGFYAKNDSTWFLKTEEKVIQLGFDYTQNLFNHQRTWQIAINDSDKVMHFFERDNKLFVFTRLHGLLNVQENLEEIPLKGFSSNDLRKIQRVMFVHEYLYLLTNSAVFYQVDLVAKHAKRFDLNAQENADLQYVNALDMDRFGTIWAATWGTGLVQIMPEKKLKSVPSASSFQKEYTDFNLGILEDSFGNVWLSSAPGIRRWTPQTGNMDFFEQLKTGSVWQIRESENGIWVSTNSKGLFFIEKDEILNPDIERATQHFSLKQGLMSDNITMTLTDSFGRLWLAHHHDGIEVFESEEAFLEANKVRAIRLAVFSRNSENPQFRIPDKSARVLFQAVDGSIWGGTFKTGIVQLADKKGDFTVWIPDSTDGLHYPHKDIRGFYQQNDKPDEFWVATYGGGVFRWNRAKKQTTFFQTQQGLSNNFTYGILADSIGNLWIPSNNGLNRYELFTGKFQVFTDSDGLNNNEFNTGALHAGKSGIMYFGGVDGVNYFNPNELTERKEPSSVKITSVKAYNRELFSPEFFKNERKLAYEDHFLSFTFTGLDLTDPGKQYYRYRLLGSDTTWIDAGNRTSTSFSNLAPGEYTFEVLAANSDGVWNPNPDRFFVEIVPPFWMTWWFRLVAFASLTGGFIWVIRYVSTQKLKEELRRLETEQKVQQERERISRDLHDHVGNQLANILSGVDLMRKYAQHGNVERSEELHGNVKDDLRNTMQQLRETIWTLNRSEVSLDEFASRLETYFRTRITDALAISVDLDESILNESIIFAPGKSLHVFRIIQEAVQNSLKYSGATLIQVQFSKRDSRLVITVHDNGKFLRREDGYEGYGLKNMRQRALEIGAEFKMRGDENGTNVELRI